MSKSACSSTSLLLKQILSLRLIQPCRCSNTLSHRVVEKHRKSRLAHDRESQGDDETLPKAPREFRDIYPDFIPDSTWYHRDRIREKLEFSDMYRRRMNISIPEFYTGSIMAVTVSDPYAPGKKNRFVGICINREGHGLRAAFTLRNVIDGQGMEITYEMYNPTLQKIEVLRLEKRLDDSLYYLRDAPAEHSTVPFDFETVPHPPGAPIPINTIKVKLNPRPWHVRWERENLQGLQDLGLPERFHKRAAEVSKPWEKYDLMLRYRTSVNDDDMDGILANVKKNMKEIERKNRAKKIQLSED